MRKYKLNDILKILKQDEKRSFRLEDKEDMIIKRYGNYIARFENDEFITGIYPSFIYDQLEDVFLISKEDIEKEIWIECISETLEENKESKTLKEDIKPETLEEENKESETLEENESDNK